MKRMTKEELKGLSDKEVKTACDRIKHDYSFGVFECKSIPRENTILLESELRRRGFARS